MRKILIIAGSRGDYGFIKPVIKEIKNQGLNYKTVITNMHLLPKFGNSVDEFEKDKISVDYKIYNTFDGYNNITMVKSLGIFLIQIPEILEEYNPDIVLISGDRGEHLMTSIACSHMNIPVAHIQAGEVSGNVDGNVRHAITKLSNIHFCSNRDAFERVRKLGEEDFRIFNVGASQLDELFDTEFPTKNILTKLNIQKDKDICLIIHHSTTDESGVSDKQTKILFDSLKNFDLIKVVIMPNSDAGSLKIRKVIEEEKSKIYVYYNLPRQDFIALLKECKFMIGNSSCGIIEAPIFKKPVLNLGKRQNKRLQTENVINCEYDTEKIVSAIKYLYSSIFLDKLKNIKSIYGEGNSSEKIVKILKEIKLDNTLMSKNITY